MLFLNPGPLHPSAFFNREKWIQYGLKYDESLKYAQDYGLWADIVQRGEVYIFSEKLVDYRETFQQISNQHKEEQNRYAKMTQKKLLLQLVDHVTEEELDLHNRYSYLANQNLKMSPKVWGWYRKLLRANDRKKIYSRSKFREYIFKILLIRSFPGVQILRESGFILICKNRSRLLYR